MGFILGPSEGAKEDVGKLECSNVGSIDGAGVG